MADLESFRTFYNDYKKGSDVTRKIGRLDHLASIFLKNYITCVDGKYSELDLTLAVWSTFGTIIKQHPKYIIIKRGPVTYTVFSERIIFIENPDDARIDEMVNLPETGFYRRAPTNRTVSWCEQFILTSHGDIMLRDNNKRFYDLIDRGETEEALKYAIGVIEGVVRGR